MRRITQEEFDKACSGSILTNEICDCVIGKDIVLPKQIKNVVFDNCQFDTPFADIEFINVTFSRCIIISEFSVCRFVYCKFNNCSSLSAECFSCCKIISTQFNFCDLRYIRFSDCEIFNTSFWCSDLGDCSFNNITDEYNVTFKNCNMVGCEAINSNIVFPQHIPSEGSFIAWKKASMREFNGDHYGDHYKHTDIIVKLRIPDDAERCSANHKCRANKVEVIQYETLDGEKLPDDIEVHSFYDATFWYHIGMIEIPDYIYYPQLECGGGIHFFLNRNDAVNYVF
jgi:hypothetical protein